MRMQGDHLSIEKLLHGNDEVVYNLVLFLIKQSDARIYSDGRSYLSVQSNANFPMWVYVNAQADKQTEEDLLSVFSKAMEGNTRLLINAQEGFAEEVLFFFSQIPPQTKAVFMPLITKFSGQP